VTARSLWQKLLCVVGRGLNVDVLAFSTSNSGSTDSTATCACTAETKRKMLMSKIAFTLPIAITPFFSGEKKHDSMF
jgi:hypothetical protein